MSTAANHTTTSNPLRTNHPVALRYLMSDTLFDLGERVDMSTVNAAVQPENPQQEHKIPELTFIGKNQSGILFITHNVATPDQHQLPEVEMDAFVKTLSALKLSLDHIALFNLAVVVGQSHTLTDILTFFNPRKTIFLGSQISVLDDAESRGVPTDLHQVVNRENIEFLRTYSFTEMMSDVDKKRLFWNQLKSYLP